ncbi:MAG: leucyl aminopeptidase family protein [Myxococcota bacterium]
MAIPQLVPIKQVADLQASSFDALVAVTSRFDFGMFPKLGQRLEMLRGLDLQLSSGVSVHHAPDLPGQRLVVAPTGPLERDFDDVRRIGDAARSGVRRARDAGATRPVIMLEPSVYPSGFERALEVAILEALASLWAPLEAREALGEAQTEPVAQLGFIYRDDGAELVSTLRALEEGRRLTRDLGGTDPERMTPRSFAQLCREVLVPAGVTVAITEDPEILLEQTPLMMAVARASLPVERHRPCLIRLEVGDPDDHAQWIGLAGKAVTYDTGGADLKVSGAMAGMSRDKGGGAAVAGLMLAAALLRPPGLRLVAEIGAVRNSIGAEAFVSDEILRSHAGTRVRVGNTDAEGRLVLADLLSHLRLEAQTAHRPRIFSVATLTGHSGRAVGPYSICIDNGPARREGVSEGLSRAGELWGDPFEISRLRREDFEFVKPWSNADDVVSSNRLASTGTDRGHQFPMAFLCVASGLDHHGRDADRPLPYTHIDIGGSALDEADWQRGRPTGAPLLALGASLFGL